MTGAINEVRHLFLWVFLFVSFHFFYSNMYRYEHLFRPLLTTMTIRGQKSDRRTPKKPFGGIAPFGTVAGPAGGGMIGDLAAGGTPLNLGKIGDTGPFLFYFKVDSYIDLYSEKLWLIPIHLASILMLLSTK